MSTGLAHEFKEQVRSRTDLVALIGESVRLEPRRGGREHVGLCPFHDDHNPSMTVSPERQSYKCWACGEGGDCFSWVMKHDGLSFPEALKLLAERAGLELPASFRRGSGKATQTKQTLYEILAWAQGQFHQFLLTGQAAKPAREYLEQRGVTEETIRRFHLGYHPDNWTWILDRARDRYSTDLLAAAGLIAERRSGDGYRDNFVDRVMFPIRDERGRTVAFGGRILPGNTKDDRKYFNSPESAIFSKSRLLYGLDAARDAIRRDEAALVVEGYTDCIMLSQHGIQSVVATLGTALTELHVDLLKRFARKVVLVYDADVAGRLAAERSLGKFLAREVDLRILTLPPNEDPADFIGRHGADAFRQLAENAVEAWEYKLQSALATHTLETIDARHRVLQEMLEVLAAAPRLAGTLREDLILSRLVRKLDIPERKVRQQLQTLRRQPETAGRAGGTPPASSSPLTTASAGPEDASGRNAGTYDARDEHLERDLLEMVFAQPDLFEAINARVGVDEFRQPQLQQLFQVCRDLWERDVAPAYEQVMSVLEEPELKRLAAEIDELSRRKKVAEKLQPAVAVEGVPPPVTLFKEVMDRLEWRRRVQGNSLPAPHVPNNSGLTPEAKSRLRQLTELRQTDPHQRLNPRIGRKR